MMEATLDRDNKLMEVLMVSYIESCDREAHKGTMSSNCPVALIDDVVCQCGRVI